MEKSAFKEGHRKYSKEKIKDDGYDGQIDNLRYGLHESPKCYFQTFIFVDDSQWTNDSEQSEYFEYPYRVNIKHAYTLNQQ